MVRIVRDELIGVQLSSCFVTVFDTRSLVELLFRSFFVYHLLFLTGQNFQTPEPNTTAILSWIIIIMIFFLLFFLFLNRSFHYLVSLECSIRSIR